MTSEMSTAYVWVWLPGETEPVVAGRLDKSGRATGFTYGRSYLDRANAIALYLPELPLSPGWIDPAPPHEIASCIADAGPDSWGQRLVMRRLLGTAGDGADLGNISTLTYLLESGSDRIGAVDFQLSPTEYIPRSGGGRLEELVGAADRVLRGEAFSPELDIALTHGSSIGGARPKALLDDGDRKLIAKLSAPTDPYPVVKAEAVAMRLAERCSIHVAHTEVVECLGHDVLLVERFDRPPAIHGGVARRLMVSALTVLGLTDWQGRHATYPDFADVIRARFTDPTATLRELFTRVVFNVCIGNTDDHAKNHAAFWDGAELTLTPAYDLCPGARNVGEVTHAMALTRDGDRRSRLSTCRSAAAAFHVEPAAADEIIERVTSAIRDHWDDVAGEARLTADDRAMLWGHQFLNPSIFYD